MRGTGPDTLIEADVADPNVTPTPAVMATRQPPGTHLSVGLPGLRFIGAGCYGSEGWGFESLRARSVLRQTTRPLTSGNAAGALLTIGFMIYQVYRFSYSHSVGLVLLTLFDAVIVYLTVVEYRKRKSHQAAGSA